MSHKILEDFAIECLNSEEVKKNTMFLDQINSLRDAVCNDIGYEKYSQKRKALLNTYARFCINNQKNDFFLLYSNLMLQQPRIKTLKEEIIKTLEQLDQ